MKLLLLITINVILFGVFFYYAAQFIYGSTTRKLFFSVFVSLILSSTVCLYEQYLPTYKQGDAMDLAGRFIFNSRVTNGVDFVRKNMTLIDVNNDLKENTYTDQVSSSSIRITDRSKLATFINNLGANSSFNGILILDIVFTTPSPDDNLLASAINSFVQKHKLILASSPVDSSVSSLKFDDAFYGDITDKAYSGKYFNHQFIKDNARASLPFKIYAAVNNIEKYDVNPILPHSGLRFIHGDKGRELFIDHMIQFNSIPYDSLSFSGEIIQLNERSMSGRQISKTENPLVVYNLGDAISEDSILFNYDLEIKNNNSPLNIVMVGSFKNCGPDIHTTMQGDQIQGSLILSSLIESVLNTKALDISGFLILLFISFFLITFYESVSFLRPKATNAGNEKGSVLLFFSSQIFRKVFLNELHFWMLFLSMFLILNITGRMMNIIALIVFFGVMELIFKVYIKQLKRKTQISS